ncbi:MAG: beta strand repeat-containing protein, partial [Methylophagaceae bacterium]
DTAVASLEAATANAASSEDVAAIAASVAENQTDLDELLANSSVFSGDVTINSKATLAAFKSIGGGLAIVNGNVVITTTADMDQADVQATVDNILTVTKDFTYTSHSNTYAETTFNNLSGVQTLTLKQGGGYKAQGLASATNIILNDAWKSTVTIVDFRALTSASSLMTGSVNHTVKFDKATEIHLTALPRYGTNLTIEGKKGGVIDITALRDVDTAGLQAGLNLSLKGPASVSISNLDGKAGSLTLEEIGSATVNSYDGAIAVKTGVTSFSADNVVDLTGSTFLETETINMTGVVDPNHTGTTADQGPAIAYTTNTDMETVTLAGTWAGVDLSNQSNLATLVISGVIVGAINLSTNADLVTATLAGSSATGITVNACDDLEALTIDTTMRGTAAAATTINGSVVVTANTDLALLTVTSDKLKTLTVTGNTSLETVNFTGVKTTGSTAGASVTINGNKLEASVAQDKTNAVGCTTCGDGKVGDLGAFTTASGIATLKTYLDAVILDTKANANVHFDTISSITGGTGVESGSNKTYAANEAEVRILKLTANTADAGDAVTTAKRSFLYGDTDDFELYVNGATVVITLTDNNSAAVSEAQFINNITTTAILASASAAGTSITATANARPKASFAINKNSSAMENSQTSAKSTFAFGLSDTFTISVDGLSASITATKTGGATILTDVFVNAVVAAWNTAHGLTATAARWTLATAVTVSADPGGLGGLKIIATASDPGSREINAAMSASWSTTGFLTDSSVGVAIGNVNNFTISTADNVAQGNETLVTLTANTAGDLLSEIGNYGTGQDNTAKNVSTTSGVVELSSSYNPNVDASATDTATNLHVAESRLDVTVADEANAAATTNKVTYNRVHWLG